MKVGRCIAAREIRRLAASAEQRTAETRDVLKFQAPAGASFHPLSDAETEAIVGGELLATLAAGTRCA